MDGIADSAFSFERNGQSASISRVESLEFRAISSDERWQGVHMETGIATHWDGDMMVNGHFVSMNVDPKPLHTEIRAEPGSWQACVRPVGAFRIHPEGSPFSLRYQGPPIRWAGAIVDGKFLDSVMGEHTELNAGLVVVDPVLQHLFSALMAELIQPSARREVTQSVIRSFVVALGLRHGRPAEDQLPKSRLTADQLETLSKWIERRLETRLTVAKIASHVNMSAVHFSRELKRATGSTPWDYVLKLRLERARKLLMEGESASATATRCGFFDQAHMTKLFKERYHETPAAFARQKRVSVA